MTKELRALRDAVAVLWGNPEDCEDCADIEERGERHEPCQIHGSDRLFMAMRAADEVLGPCRCGHPASQHHDEDTTRCKACDCNAFRLPPAQEDR